MTSIRMLWQFVTEDDLGRWLAIVSALVAWFALTWLSLGATIVLAGLVGAIALRRRAWLAAGPPDDDLDDLF